MVSVVKMGVYGMRDERWTVQDKLSQIHGLMNLNKRDHDQVLYNVSNLRKAQYTEIRDLKRQVDEYRALLDTARVGDKQRLRNTLSAHRPTQIAYKEKPPEKVVVHLEHINFVMSKEMNKLKFQKKQHMSSLFHLQMDAKNLQKERTRQQQEVAIPSREQTLLSLLNNCTIKQSAAIAVSYTYQNIVDILKKDTIYFDVILNALHSDAVSQGRCVLRATAMGQSAAEDLARLRSELQHVEADVKCGMQDRARAVAALKSLVERNRALCKNLVRVESDETLIEDQHQEETAELLKEMQSMESLMQKLQGTTLVSTYMDIFPRFEDQLRQRKRLLRQVEKREERRDNALDKRNHAQLMLHSLQHTMSTTTQGYKEEKEELIAKAAEEQERAKAKIAEMKILGRQMVGVRAALFNIGAILNQVKPGDNAESKVPKEFAWTVDEAAMDELYSRKYGPPKAPKNNAMVMLQRIYSRVGILLQQMNKMDQKAMEVPEHLMNTRPLLPELMLEKPSPQNPDERAIDTLVMETELEDTNVPTRAAIKLESSRIVEYFERPPTMMDVSRMKRVRKDEKWL